MINYKMDFFNDNWDEMQPLITPIQVYCKTRGPDQFGEVTEGCLTLIGGVSSVRLMRQVCKDEQQEEPSKRNVKFGVRRHNVLEFLQFHPDWRWLDEDGWSLIPEGHTLPSSVPNAVFFERKEEDLFIMPTASIGAQVHFLGLRYLRSQGTVREYERMGLGSGNEAEISRGDLPSILTIF